MYVFFTDINHIGMYDVYIIIYIIFDMYIIYIPITSRAIIMTAAWEERKQIVLSLYAYDPDVLGEPRMRI